MTMIDAATMERLQNMLQARHDMVAKYGKSGLKTPQDISSKAMEGQGEVRGSQMGPKGTAREQAMMANVALGTLGRQFEGRVQQGLIGGLLTGHMPGLMDVLNPIGITAGFASALPGAVTSATLGIVDPISKFARTTASLLGGLSLGPVGGVLGGIAGMLGGDALADALGTREDEGYRDVLEDKFGYFSGRRAYSMGTPSFHSSMLDQSFGREPTADGGGRGQTSFGMSDIDSYSDAVGYVSAPVESFDVDFGYLSDPELSYTYDPITAPPAKPKRKAKTSTTAGKRDSTTFGEDIGQTFGGDMDPQGDRMGGLDASFGGGGGGGK